MSEDLKWCGFTFDAGGDEATCHLGLPLQVRLLLLVFLRRQTLCLKAIWCLFFPSLSPLFTQTWWNLLLKTSMQILWRIDSKCFSWKQIVSIVPAASHIELSIIQPHYSLASERDIFLIISTWKKKVWGAKSYVNILWSNFFFFFFIILFYSGPTTNIHVNKA